MNILFLPKYQDLRTLSQFQQSLYNKSIGGHIGNITTEEWRELNGGSGWAASINRGFRSTGRGQSDYYDGILHVQRDYATVI